MASDADVDMLHDFQRGRIDHGYASVVSNPEILLIRLQRQPHRLHARRYVSTTFHVVVSTTATWFALGMLTNNFVRSAVSAQSSPGLFSMASASNLLPPKPSNGSITDTLASSFSAST